MGTHAPRIAIWHGSPHGGSVRVPGDFGAIVRSERLPALLDGVARLGGTVIAALASDELRGYATLVPSSALGRDRWENLPDAFELGSIEVARSSRGHGIGTELLAHLPATLPVEQVLLFARGFVSHWDIERARLSPVDYRRMLLRMLGRAGFHRWDTDDPEVEDHPMNFLAVRPGRSVPSASLLAFTQRARTAAGEPWW